MKCFSFCYELFHKRRNYRTSLPLEPIQFISFLEAGTLVIFVLLLLHRDFVNKVMK